MSVAEVRQRLAGMWGDKLGITEVGPQDNFFALGGDSLLAADLLMDVYEEFGVEVDAAVVFLTPTIAALAEKILAARREETPV